MPVIEVRDLTKRYGDVAVVDRLTFSVDRGTVVGFLGPNGAGKTTTLRVLLGLVAANGGGATFAGVPYRDLPEPLRHVGAVLEASDFHPGRTARNHLRVQAMATGIAASRIDEVLGLVGLREAADRKVGGFSLGMRQRLGIATAMLGDPDVLILDEPANGLDPEGVRWLRELVRGLAEEGRTVLISSHILAEVAQTVDSVVIIDEGRLVADSSLADLLEGMRRVVRVRTPEAQRLADALERDGDGVTITHAGADRLEVSGSSPERIGMLAAELRIPILESAHDDANLEDVFFRLTDAPDDTPAGAPAGAPAGPTADAPTLQEVSR